MTANVRLTITPARVITASSVGEGPHSRRNARPNAATDHKSKSERASAEEA